MRIEFEYTFNDLREGIWWGRRARTTAAVLGWLVFLEYGAFALWHQQARQPVDLRRDWAAMLPWVAFPLFVVVVMLDHLYQRPRSAWKTQPTFHLPQSIELDHQGVRARCSLLDAHYSWNYFLRWMESPNLLLLIMPGKFRLIIPKRAVPPEQLSALRDLVDSRVQGPTRGFPVNTASGNGPA